MRDLYLHVPGNPEETSWNMDIDVIDGFPRLVPAERNTQDQRAALATYTVKGTIPGKADEGIDWGLLYNQGATILDIDNSIKQNIQQKAAIPGTATQTYIPIYTKDESGMHAVIYQAS